MKTFASLLVLAAMVSVPALAAGPSSSSSGSSSLGTSGSTSGAPQATAPGSSSSTMGGSSSTLGGSSSLDQTAALESNTDMVRQVESKLKSEGYDVGEVDGVMDDKARDALTKFQEKRGLQKSGKLDSETMAALDITDSQQAATPGSSAGPTTAPSASPSMPSTPPTSPSTPPSSGTSR